MFKEQGGHCEWYGVSKEENNNRRSEIRGDRLYRDMIIVKSLVFI